MFHRAAPFLSPSTISRAERSRARLGGMSRGEAPPGARGGSHPESLAAETDDTEVWMWTLEAIAEARRRTARTQQGAVVGPPTRASNVDNSQGVPGNVWYGSSSGGGGKPGGGRTKQQPAVTRCDAVLDSGRTRGDVCGETYKCVHFARGACAAGGACSYLHTLPTAADEAAMSKTHDVFGRERNATDRENNGGVGSFVKNVKTLFVYYGGAASAGHLSKDAVVDLLRSNFQEWGHVADVHAVPTKCLGFVNFSLRVSAEFAKEAMAGQTLLGKDSTKKSSAGKKKLASDTSEALSVKWANEDPNPDAVQRVKREREDLVVDAVKRVESRMPKAQRVARDQAGKLDDGAYPDTDDQYPDAPTTTATVSPDCLPIPRPDTTAAVPLAAPPPKAGLPEIDTDELAKIKAAIGLPVAESPDDDDDECEFDPDAYPQFEVEEV